MLRRRIWSLQPASQVLKLCACKGQSSAQRSAQKSTDVAFVAAVAAWLLLLILVLLPLLPFLLLLQAAGLVPRAVAPGAALLVAWWRWLMSLSLLLWS